METNSKRHIVKTEFRDRNNFEKVNSVGDDVSHFEKQRLSDLVEADLVMVEVADEGNDHDNDVLTIDYKEATYTKETVLAALKLAKPTSKLTIASKADKILAAVLELPEEAILVFEGNIVAG